MHAAFVLALLTPLASPQEGAPPASTASPPPAAAPAPAAPAADPLKTAWAARRPGVKEARKLFADGSPGDIIHCVVDYNCTRLIQGCSDFIGVRVGRKSGNLHSDRQEVGSSRLLQKAI